MRIEHDVHGQVSLADDCYYGLQTARAVENFPILRQPVHPELVRALVLVKKAAARTNLKHGWLEPAKGQGDSSGLR
jgi:aspartate ammonia-lyase